MKKHEHAAQLAAARAEVERLMLSVCWIAALLQYVSTPACFPASPPKQMPTPQSQQSVMAS